MIYVRTGPPADTPVSLPELKAHLRLDADDGIEDLLLTAYLEAAVDHLDGRTGILNRCLVDQEWTAYADGPVHRAFQIGLGPVRTDLTVTVEHRSAGDWLTVDPDHVWVTQESGGRASVIPAPGRAWPSADVVRNAWRITFTAGFGEPADVPAGLKAAILLIAGDLYADRDGKTPATLVENPTIARLLASHRMVSV